MCRPFPVGCCFSIAHHVGQLMAYGGRRCPSRAPFVSNWDGALVLDMAFSKMLSTTRDLGTKGLTGPYRFPIRSQASKRRSAPAPDWLLVSLIRRHPWPSTCLVVLNQSSCQGRMTKTLLDQEKTQINTASTASTN